MKSALVWVRSGPQKLPILTYNSSALYASLPCGICFAPKSFFFPKTKELISSAIKGWLATLPRYTIFNKQVLHY